MSSIIIPSRRIRRNFKPDFPVRLNGNMPTPNSLTLLRDVSAQQWFDVARDEWYPISASGLAQRATPYGTGVKSTITSGIYLNSWGLNGHDVDTGPFTALVVVDYQENPSGSFVERIAPYYAATTGGTGVLINSSGFNYTLRSSTVSTLAPADFGLQVIVVRVTDGGDQQFYRNGFLDYQGTLSTFWTASGDAQIYSSAGGLKNSLLAMGGWKRDLGPDFCRELSAEGWPMLLEPMRKTIWVPMGGGGAVNLDGVATSQATATGALTHSVPIAGAGLSVATATGALSLSIPLAGAASAQSTATGDLSTAGSAALSGNATAQANASGGLSLSIPLSAAAVAQALASAGLSHGVPLAGAAAGQAAAGGALTLNISLSGAAISQAAASAGLTVTNASSMAAAATAQASASGTLTHGVPLTGAALTVSSAGGALTQIVPLAGSAASASMATGGLDVAVRLQADALVQALAAAGLDVQGGLSGAAAAIAGAGATLTLRINLAGDAVANAIASGALSTAGLIIDSTPGWVISSSRRSWKTSAVSRKWRIAT